MSECLWTGRDCSENTRDFPLTLGVLWVSDISYIQTEDLEDPDEGEYLVARTRLYFTRVPVVARVRRRVPRLDLGATWCLAVRSADSVDGVRAARKSPGVTCARDRDDACHDGVG